MININYQKRKNTELFKSLENTELLNLSFAQNYIPIYKRFFVLNQTNYNNINLNNEWFITQVKSTETNNSKLYNCKLKNINTEQIQNKTVFFKLAPLIDIYKYLVGKYDVTDESLFNLPVLNSNENNCNAKMLDVNNSAYVDSFFVFLTSILLNKYNFIHGLDFYGSFLAIKNNFIVNVFDDLEYLNESDFFNKNKNVLFDIDNYDHLFDTKGKLTPIKIENVNHTTTCISLHSINDDIFDNVFDNNNATIMDNNDLVEMSLDMIELTPNITDTIRSQSTYSSRTSYTSNCSECDSDENNTEVKDDDMDDSSNDDMVDNDDADDYEDDGDDEYDDEDEDEDEDEDDDEDDDDEEELINVNIKKFPVQVICMENCENTFDELLQNELSTDEWLSALMQIIMMLITYQKVFSLTHNDLHLNNIMFNSTTKKYIIYKYNKVLYKVPTFGRLFKIIDFGRSIYKFNNQVFCSDSFKKGNDAATQYNTEPYLNDSKPRLEPNFSFDLCRLACSIFDYLIKDLEEVKDISKIADPVKKLIVEWCLDDKGTNVLYKNNGAERYPEFKLYKMIARIVHKHTPQLQLERAEFKNYILKYTQEKKIDIDIDIDSLPML